MLGKLLQRAKAPPVRNVGQWLDLTPPGYHLDPGYQLHYVEDVENLPAVAASLDAYTSALLQMPLEAVRADADGVDEVLTPAPPIIDNPTPGPGRNVTDFLAEYTRSILLWGNYFAILGDDGWTGWPTGLQAVPQGQYMAEQLGDGTYRWRVNGTPYAPDEVFHVTRNRAPGERLGRGLLQRNQLLISGAMQAEAWTTRYFASGALPPAVISHPNPDLTQDQASDIKTKFGAAMSASPLAPIVLPAGTTVTPLPNSAEGAQLVQSRQWFQQELATALGVPPVLIGLPQQGASMTYKNIQNLFDQWLKSSLMGLIIPLEAALSNQCLPRGTRARLNTDALLRPDLETRFALWAQALGGAGGTPWLTVDEVRNAEGREPWADAEGESAEPTEPPAEDTGAALPPPAGAGAGVVALAQPGEVAA